MRFASEFFCVSSLRCRIHEWVDPAIHWIREFAESGSLLNPGVDPEGDSGEDPGEDPRADPGMNGFCAAGLFCETAVF